MSTGLAIRSIGSHTIWHTLASPDGATVLSILLSYRYVRHEQRARLDRMATWEEYDDAS